MCKCVSELCMSDNIMMIGYQHPGKCVCGGGCCGCLRGGKMRNYCM